MKMYSSAYDYDLFFSIQSRILQAYKPFFFPFFECKTLPSHNNTYSHHAGTIQQRLPPTLKESQTINDC
ncbi:hypothetical protein RIF29_37206 [Crotalaria pallida]|uniref:Uncharacterized protein n=1 Tax=Crotalaria pallida TaxID=3830 RepID=A0AAN9EE64_CROPI